MDGDDKQVEGPIVNGRQMSFIGHDIESIPTNNAIAADITRLDVSFNIIRSLVGIELFTNLQEFIADNNELDDQTEFPPLPNLHTLTLNKNKINDLDTLLDKLSKSYPRLRYLSLLGNKACPHQLVSCENDDDDYRRYRYYVLYKIPHLKFLDSSSVTATEISEAQRQGAFLKVVRLPEDAHDDNQNDSHSKQQYTPLPNTSREETDHAATFGKCRYVYYGKHSEGNRFIRNNDL